VGFEALVELSRQRSWQGRGLKRAWQSELGLNIFEYE